MNERLDSIEAKYNSKQSKEEDYTDDEKQLLQCLLLFASSYNPTLNNPFSDLKRENKDTEYSITEDMFKTFQEL